LQLTKLVITMNAKMAGVNKVINRCKFVDGRFEFVGQLKDCEGFARYFDASFNCTIWMGRPNEDPAQVAPEPEVVEEVLEDEADGDITEREQKILEAIQCVEPEEWVEDVTPHPSVATIAELIEDSTVTKDEIVAVIENWMDDEVEEEEPQDEDAPEETEPQDEPAEAVEEVVEDEAKKED